MMKRWRGGIRLGRRLVRLWRRCVLRFGSRLRRRPPSSEATTSAVASRLLDWGRSLSRRIRSPRPGGDRELLLEPPESRPPKGHLAVYVGGGGRWQASSPRRYVVPVVYFNHPLFGELLRESEEEFGFHHPGGITIPCPAAKFEHVRTRIAATAAAAAPGGLHLRRKGSSGRFRRDLSSH